MTTGSREAPAEWDAGTYQRDSASLMIWDQKLLQPLPLSGSETVVAARGGSGLLTGELLDHNPGNHVVAGDRSANMLAQAAALLVPRFGERVTSPRLRAPLDVFPDEATQHAFMDEITGKAAGDGSRYALDSWQPNLAATRPFVS